MSASHFLTSAALFFRLSTNGFVAADGETANKNCVGKAHPFVKRTHNHNTRTSLNKRHVLHLQQAIHTGNQGNHVGQLLGAVAVLSAMKTRASTEFHMAKAVFRTACWSVPLRSEGRDGALVHDEEGVGCIEPVRAEECAGL
jgi:hypothetical protein